MIEHAKTFLEHKAFGVCEWWAHKLNIKTEQVRLSFIYLGFRNRRAERGGVLGDGVRAGA
jgi:phage shock protein PspC (stress-responsive transcriptional regulator)